MPEEIIPHHLCRIRGDLRGKILRRNGKGQTAGGEHEQQDQAFHKKRDVPSGDARIDHFRHDDRDEKLERGLQHFEEGRQDGFHKVNPHIRKKSFHDYLRHGNSKAAATGILIFVTASVYAEGKPVAMFLFTAPWLLQGLNCNVHIPAWHDMTYQNEVFMLKCKRLCRRVCSSLHVSNNGQKHIKYIVQFLQNTVYFFFGWV